ncbi:MAG: hypothetical protein ACRC1H_12045, partial [Caldilineaceae bacterium]
MSISPVPTLDAPAPEMPVSTERLPAEPVAPIDLSCDFPGDETLRLHLRVGACRLVLQPLPAAAPAEAWLRGVYRDPAGALPLKVTCDGGELVVTQEPQPAALPGLINNVPTLELGLGAGRPYALLIETGASESNWELGGLPLTSINCRLGAGKADVRFSTPLPAPVHSLRVDVGAAELRMAGLGRLDCADMLVSTGAASVHLDFDVRPSLPTNLTLEGGLSGAAVTTPAGTPVRLKGEMLLGDIKVDPAFVRNEEAWWSPTALAGERP